MSGIRHYEGSPFTKKDTEIRDKLVSSVRNGALLFQNTFTSLPKEGVIVRHSGSSGNRVGWIGVIVALDCKDSPSQIGVRWLITSNGYQVRSDRSFDIQNIGVYQSYTIGWCRASMQVGRVRCYSIEDLFNEAVLEQKKEVLAMENNNHKGQFIVWGQNGKTNPVNVTGYDQAIQAAEAMTIRHNSVFHVAKLVTRVSPKVKITPQHEEL